MDVRHAVRQLYVKPSAPSKVGTAGREWQRALDGGLRREPANQDSLPGPCGGQSLHLHPKQAQEDTTEPHLPKASARHHFPVSPECMHVDSLLGPRRGEHLHLHLMQAQRDKIEPHLPKAIVPPLPSH